VHIGHPNKNNMKAYLVIDNCKNKLISYEQQYQVFDSVDKAIDHAKSIGYTDPFGMGINTKTGMANMTMCGNVNVTILPIEIQ